MSLDIDVFCPSNSLRLSASLYSPPFSFHDMFSILGIHTPVKVSFAP